MAAHPQRRADIARSVIHLMVTHETDKGPAAHPIVAMSQGSFADAARDREDWMRSRARIEWLRKEINERNT